MMKKKCGIVVFSKTEKKGVSGGISGGISGFVLFEEYKHYVQVTFALEGFPKANTKYAVHIHEYGDLRNGCTSLGSHFNPYQSTHGGIMENRQKRHVGDMMNNLTTNSKKECFYTYQDPTLRLSGKFSILGRSLVLHEGKDDMGKGGFPDSLVTGHAGKRMACGIIGICNQEDI
jgi:Cu-Zn family superoxide dismutase